MIENLLPFPIYESKEQQFRFRKNCIGEIEHSFRVPTYAIPSFCFKREKRLNRIGVFRIFDIKDNLVYLNDFTELFMRSAGDYDVIGYISNRIANDFYAHSTECSDPYNYLNWNLPCGKYYMILSEDGGNKHYYSEIFEVVDVAGITDNIELVRNPKFNNQLLDNWQVSTGWTVVSGKASYDGSSGGFLLSQILQNFSADAYHWYKFTITITDYDNGGNADYYLKAYCNGLDAVNAIFIDGNGTYTHYFRKVSRFIIQSCGSVSFGVTEVSIQKVVGNEEHLSILSVRTCKFPNSVLSSEKGVYPFISYFLFETWLLTPEYGEELTANENKNLEKIVSYARPYKRHKMATLTLPEPVADMLAQLNTFDLIEVNDGIKGDLFRQYSLLSPFKSRSIQSFNPKFEWVGQDCYMVADIAFDENIVAFDRCCDDLLGVVPCYKVSTSHLSIAVSADSVRKYYSITLDDSSNDLTGAMVRLTYGKVLNDDYVDCDDTWTGITTDIEIPFTTFAANGMKFYPSDFDTYKYAFKVVLKQVGCNISPLFSNCATSENCLTIRYASGCYTKQLVPVSPSVWHLTIDLDAVICTDGCTLQLWDSFNSVWVTVPAYWQLPNTLVQINGSQTIYPVISQLNISNITHVTKIRVMCGSDFSNDVPLALATC